MSGHALLQKFNQMILAKLGAVIPDFLSYGLKTDTIAESTAAAGVTIDGVLVKDGAVTGNLTGNVTGDIDAAQGAIDTLTGEIATLTGDPDHVASGTSAQQIGQLRTTVFDKTLTVTTAVSAVSLGISIPADALLQGFACKVTDALSGAGGGAKLGIAWSGAAAASAAAWGVGATLTLNTKITNYVGENTSAIKTPKLFALSADGINAKGTIGAGAVRVTGSYVSVQALA